MNNNIEVTVLVNDKPIKTYYHQGRAYVEARYGDEYSIKIRNNNWYRVEAVVSIDGLDVLDGQLASSNKRGYIINAYSTVEIKGFRSDLNTVGRFKFVKRKKSYAKQVTGNTQNVGVIGVRCFMEEAVVSCGSTITFTQPNPFFTTSPANTWLCLNNNVSVSGYSPQNSLMGHAASNAQNGISVHYCSMQCSSVVPTEMVPDFKVGTTWGTKTEDRVTEVSFNRGREIASFEIFYNERKELEKIGIRFDKTPMISVPRAFPKPFAAPPPGWR